MADELRINDHFALSMETIELTYARSSGPGGQNVNKVASKAILRWNLDDSALDPDAKARFRRMFPSSVTVRGDVVLSSQEFRDAPKNRKCCLDKLHAMLEQAIRVPKKRIPTKPTLGSVRRRLRAKAELSIKKLRRRPVSGEE